MRLVREELDELDYALNNEPTESVLKELADVIYVTNGLYATIGYSNSGIVELFPEDELAEFSDFVETRRATVIDVREMFSGEVVSEALRRVHQSNMSKLGEDGKPLRRADGKILKGPNYKPPVLIDLV